MSLSFKLYFSEHSLHRSRRSSSSSSSGDSPPPPPPPPPPSPPPSSPPTLPTPSPTSANPVPDAQDETSSPTSANPVPDAQDETSPPSARTTAATPAPASVVARVTTFWTGSGISLPGLDSELFLGGSCGLLIFGENPLSDLPQVNWTLTNDCESVEEIYPWLCETVVGKVTKDG